MAHRPELRLDRPELGARYLKGLPDLLAAFRRQIEAGASTWPQLELQRAHRAPGSGAAAPGSGAAAPDPAASMLPPAAVAFLQVPAVGRRPARERVDAYVRHGVLF